MVNIMCGVCVCLTTMQLKHKDIEMSAVKRWKNILNNKKLE